ncbi:hypothetical protein B0H63DRAFT_176715 [Podospora didyma]|uniref:Uncharacterized protein n=1 Tax=Podospora didyma TaxID=330526 RepID=A0AAE0TZ84_9PEZI|nr:hypothetical protein B0H63DRAFT_176715 [Podospora didyma]
MSSSIVIPAPSIMDYDHIRQSGKAAPSSSSSSSPSSSSPSSSSPSSYSSSPTTPGLTLKSPHSTHKQKMLHSRRPSLLSSALSKQECTTINIADPDGPPRLISYLASSQGFAWNPEIFLPSYVDYEYVPLENRRDPVHEIVLSDDEIKKILPQ